jgi:hypothetical protein
VLFVCSEINISSLIFTTFGSFYHANELFPKTHAIISGSGQNQRRVFTTSSASYFGIWALKQGKDKVMYNWECEKGGRNF